MPDPVLTARVQIRVWMVGTCPYKYCRNAMCVLQASGFEVALVHINAETKRTPLAHSRKMLM